MQGPRLWDGDLYLWQRGKSAEAFDGKARGRSSNPAQRAPWRSGEIFEWHRFPHGLSGPWEPGEAHFQRAVRLLRERPHGGGISVFSGASENIGAQGRGFHLWRQNAPDWFWGLYEREKLSVGGRLCPELLVWQMACIPGDESFSGKGAAAAGCGFCR